MTLDFEPIWPWPLVLFAFAVMCAVVWVGYPGRIRHLPIFWRRVLLGLRIATVLLLTFWLLRPAVITESDDRSDAALYVVLDTSASMNTPDEVGSKTRFAALQALLDQASPLLDEIGEKVDVRIRALDEELTTFDPQIVQADGSYTAIGANLDRLAKEAGREKIAAVLLWSDGKQAASGTLDVDPVQSARLLGRQHRPVYSVPFGSSDVTSAALDLSVSDLDMPRDAFVRNEVPVKVRLRALGAVGQDVQLRILIEDRSGVPVDQSGDMQSIVADRDNVSVKWIKVDQVSQDTIVSLQFVPEQVGEVKIAVEVVPLKEEVRITNNRVETIIRVRSGGIRVAYFDSLRPEFKFLRSITDSSRVQLDAMPVWSGRFASRNNFDESWFEPGNYDAFIIGNVSAETLGQDRIQKLVECLNQGAGLMMIGGENSFGSGGYHRTSLARFLPVVMSDNDKQLENDVAMVPRRAALSNPILQIASPDQNSRRWNELPPLQGANLLRLRPASAAQVLAETPTRSPLLISQSTGAARVMAFAGDTTWQWVLHEDWAANAHQRFWRQVIFWLTKMENDGENPLWVNAEPRNLNPGRLEELSFGLRDENGLPLANVDYEVTIRRPDGETETVPSRIENLNGAADFSNTLEPGDYFAVVSADSGQGRGIQYARTRFIVNARNPELDNPAADPSLLRELAHVSGGDFLTPRTMIERLEQWAADGLPSLEMTRSERTTLWDNWISLLLFVILLMLEWFFRKKRGLV